MTGWQRVRVPAGFVFGLVYLYLCRPTPVWLIAGLILSMVGAGLRVWAAGHLEKWKNLAVSGPYRWTRNPLYLGSFTIGLGLSVASGRLLLLLLFVFFFSAFYIPVMRREEQELIDSFGDAYKTYRAGTPLFFPRFTAAETSGFSRSNFSWKRVISNREYNAVLGLLGFAALIGLKMLWV